MAKTVFDGICNYVYWFGACYFKVLLLILTFTNLLFGSASNLQIHVYNIQVKDLYSLLFIY